MKCTRATTVVMLPLIFIALHANAKGSKANGYETGTIVSVEKYAPTSNYVDGSPSDAPLQADVYRYDIGIELNCNIYVGRYESATDYLPASFAASQTVDVRLDKHVLYVSLPESDRIVKMGIVTHKHIKEHMCRVSG